MMSVDSTTSHPLYLVCACRSNRQKEKDQMQYE